MENAPEPHTDTDILAGMDNAVQEFQNKEALCDARTSHTYRSLDAITDAIAERLIGCGVGPEKLVGLEFERPIDYVLGMLSVLKAGGAFAIVDSGSGGAAHARRNSLSNAVLWLTRGAPAVPTLEAAAARILDLDDIDECNSCSISWRTRLIADSQLAYILFTSGSTGEPKGALLERRNLSAYVAAACERLQLSAADRWMQIASPAFDVFLEETLPVLTRGGTVVCTERGAMDLASFHRSLIRSSATVVEMTTAYWYEYRKFLILTGTEPPAALRLLVVGGESMDINAYRDWQQRFDTPLMHVYGITETSISSTMFSGRLSEQDTEVPVGAPLSGHCVTVRENCMALPGGVEGDIWISGSGVGRGYLDNAALTASRFVPDPMGPVGSRAYLTGDRGVVGAEGQLIFRGRLDDQVKIRGYRLELSEVETALRLVDEIEQACVLIDPAANTALIAFVALNADLAQDTVTVEISDGQRRRILESLAAKLPPWAIPARIIGVKTLPKTDRGKIDRQALLALLRSGSSGRSTPAEAADPKTDRVLDAFRSALGQMSLGADDDFFESGGDSLTALTAITLLGSPNGLDLTAATIFDSPSARELARWIEQQSLLQLGERAYAPDDSNQQQH